MSRFPLRNRCDRDEFAARWRERDRAFWLALVVSSVGSLLSGSQGLTGTIDMLASVTGLLSLCLIIFRVVHAGDRPGV